MKVEEILIEMSQQVRALAGVIERMDGYSELTDNCQEAIRDVGTRLKDLEGEIRKGVEMDGGEGF